MGGSEIKVGLVLFGEAFDLPKSGRRFYFVASSSYPSAGCSSAEPASVSLDESNLSQSSGFSSSSSWVAGTLFKLRRWLVTQGAVEPMTIVVDFNVLEQSVDGLGSWAGRPRVNQFIF